MEDKETLLTEKEKWESFLLFFLCVGVWEGVVRGSCWLMWHITTGIWVGWGQTPSPAHLLLKEQVGWGNWLGWGLNLLRVVSLLCSLVIFFSCELKCSRWWVPSSIFWIEKLKRGWLGTWWLGPRIHIWNWSTSGTTGFENNSFTFQIQNHTPPALPEKEGSDGDWCGEWWLRSSSMVSRFGKEVEIVKHKLGSP